jgi:hypothetical protein
MDRSCTAASTGNGSDGRDCRPWKCADYDTLLAGGARGQRCETLTGWVPPTLRESVNPTSLTYTQMRLRPAVGTVSLRRVSDGTMFGPITLTDSRVIFRGLPVGAYQPIVNVDGTGRLWRSKSVPSTAEITVEAGLTSRALLVYRPLADNSFTVPMRMRDDAIPLEPTWHPGWPAVRPDGSIYWPNSSFTYCLVPVPQGRLLLSERSCATGRRSASTPSFTFDNIEPGLYSSAVTDGRNYSRFVGLTGTGGYIYVSDDGTVQTTADGRLGSVELLNTVCPADKRDQAILDGKLDANGRPLTSCRSAPPPPGPRAPYVPPPSGFSGGGFS